MGTRAVVETRRDRKALVADAGYKPLSIVSVLAGVLTAYGAFAVLAGIAVGVIRAADVDIDLSSQWQDLGVAGGLVVAGLLLLSYLFGGYVAGRMARRSGVLHGGVVFVLGLALVALAAWFARQLGGADVAAGNLRDLGLPTTAGEWRDIATVAGVASLAAMALGALLGGTLGERWHDKLLRRALDPQVGAEAQARRDAERRATKAEELRTDSYRRVRVASPTRTRRVDAATAGTDDHDDPDTQEVVRVPASTQVVDRPRADEDRAPAGRRGSHHGNGNGNGTSFWWRRPAETDADAGRSVDGGATDRRTVRSGGRTA